MLKEIRNNVYNAEFVAADEEGRRYVALTAIGTANTGKRPLAPKAASW